MSFSKRLIALTVGWLIIITLSVMGFSYVRNRQIITSQQVKSDLQTLAFFRNRMLAHQDSLTFVGQEIALNTDVQQALVRGDRAAIEAFMSSAIKTASTTQLRYYRIYLPPGLYFTGNNPNDKAQAVPAEKLDIVENVFNTGKPHAGWDVENGSGLGLYAIVPIFYEGRTVGALEIVTPIDNQALQALTAFLSVHWQISLPSDLAAAHNFSPHIQTANPDTDDLLVLQASSQYIPVFNTRAGYETALQGEVSVNVIRQGGQIYDVISAPIEHRNQILGVVDIVVNQTVQTQQHVKTMFTNILIIFSIIALIGLGLIQTINRSTAALTEIAQAAQLVAAGNYDTHIPVERDDEIGHLAKAFNEMVARVRDLVESLDQRVHQRTQALQRRAALLQATADVGNILVTYHDLDDVLFQMVRRISDRFGFYHAGIFLLDERHEYAVLRAANSAGGQRMLQRGHRLRIGQVGIVGYVAASGQARIALDVGKDAVYFDNPDLPETRSEMALPIIVQRKIVGVLDIQSRQPNAFSEEDITVLQSLANQLAIAIENSLLYEQAQEALARAESMQTEQTSHIWRTLASERTENGFVSTSQGIRPVTDDTLDALQKKALASGQTQISEDGLTLVAPVRTRNVTIGLLRLRKHDLMPAWQRDEIDMLGILLEQFSAAIENARLYTETQRRAAIESAIEAASSKLTMAANVESVLRETARALAEYLGSAEVTVKMNAAAQGETSHD